MDSGIKNGLAAALVPMMWWQETSSVILGWGWLLVVVILLWATWKVYMTIKALDYLNGIQWTVIQITVPDESEKTPKAMENAINVWEGIHKNPDLIERYFEGYIEAWYSCEIHCSKGKARYIMVVPAVHKTFFEGVIYGQYPEANIVEVDDYTQRYRWQDLEEKYDLYGTEVSLVNEDYLPIRTYHDYEDMLAEEDKYIDPHQALIEAYTNINEGDEFWVQMLVRPIDAKDIKKWEEKGEEEIDKLAGKETKKELGLIGKVIHAILQMPIDMLKAAAEGPLEPDTGKRDSLSFPITSEADKAKMDGILRKVASGGSKVKIRVLYIAPVGKLTKPNISRAIGGFKQFNTFNLNSFRPDPDTKTNGPNYIFKKWRRYWRKRKVLLYFQWRDLGPYKAGQMMSSEEIATIYHFPIKYLKAPAVERAKAGTGGAPENIPYA